MHRVTVKTSTIFIAKGGRTRVYRSVNEIPQGLRKQLEESTNGFNSATILIADRRGRQELVRALQGLPTSLRTRLAPSLSPESPQPQTEVKQPIRPLARFLRRNWAAILWPGAVGVALWLALNYHW